MPQRSILVADDIENHTDAGIRRSQAIRNAATFLAPRLKTGIELLYVEDLKDYPSANLGSFQFVEWHSTHQERLEEIGRRFTVPVSCSLKSGSPSEQILRVLLSRPSPELVVVGTQGRKGVKRLLIGSVAEEVIRHSKRPVMVIGPKVREMDKYFSNQKQLKILIPTDLGKNSRAAEQYGLSLAKRTGARVSLFHCLWDSINTIIINNAYHWRTELNINRIVDKARDDAFDFLRQKTAFFQKHSVPCEYKIEEQEISRRAVYQECESGYSMVVMGTHGRNALANAFFGSAARETILNTAIPVIVVHSGK